jgi:hypothetical protein
MDHVGHRVELIGRIASVEGGVVKGGPRHGRPCLQANFSRHRRNIVRLAIWSEAGDFPATLGRDWVGRWVSAVGLIGEPFVSDAFLVPRTHIGISLGDPSEINFISAKQAEYRLAQSNRAPRAEEHQIVPSPGGFAAASNRQMPLHNQEIVEQMLASSPRAPVATPVPRRVATAVPAASSPNPSGNINSQPGSPGRVSGRPPKPGTGIFLGRAARALLNAIIWGAVAIGMYALLLALGYVGGPFDVVGEFGSVIAALFRAISAVIGGAGLSKLAVVVPGPPGQEGLIFLVAALLRLSEIVALLAVTVAAVRILSATHRALARGRP